MPIIISLEGLVGSERRRMCGWFNALVAKV